MTSAAFTDELRRLDGQMRALAYRILGDFDAMEDALQDAYVKAYRALPSFRGDAGVSTWLYRIVYNSCIDATRDARRRSAVDRFDTTAVETAEPQNAVAVRVDLAHALAQLPIDQRAAVLLVDAEGLSYADVAEVLGVPAGTLASRVSRARAALRLALTEGDPA
jgi:RNA polymerase sigma-70 factor (ECF subfamily)